MSHPKLTGGARRAAIDPGAFSVTVTLRIGKKAGLPNAAR
jgi:hypothetical protein